MCGLFCNFVGLKHQCEQSGMKVKSMLKSELAEMAGVSLSTFGRWLKTETSTLERLGVYRRTKLVPPIAVRYICDKYGIDIEEDETPPDDASKDAPAAVPYRTGAGAI